MFDLLYKILSNNLFQIFYIKHYFFCVFMQMNFNTTNCTTREEALEYIIQNMKKTIDYIPLAYRLEHSGCSCCRADYFYLLFLYKGNYEMITYHANMKHERNCLHIRCWCHDPFDWKNINPERNEIVETEIQYWLDCMISVNKKDNDSWKLDFEYYFYYYFQQEIENNAILEYNNIDDDNKEEEVYLKNYHYYF